MTLYIRREASKVGRFSDFAILRLNLTLLADLFWFVCKIVAMEEILFGDNDRDWSPR